jgi:hypothetical protein
VEAVLVEAAYFLPVRTRVVLADLAARFSVDRIHGRKRFELELLR